MGQEHASLLVVEDHPTNRELLVRRLRTAGYAVSEAADGQEALDLVELHTFDLILLDVMMPRLDGNEVLRRLRQRWSAAELPVIMVSARGAHQEVVQALADGANDYIVKPSDFRVALARIQTHLRISSMENALRAARDDALAASKEKSDFLARISHDIRTPMNAIVGVGDLLRETEMDDEQERYVQVLRSASHTLLGLINDVLDLSKIESGQLSLERIEIEIRELVEDVRDIVGLAADQRTITLCTEVDDNVPQHVRGDPNRLRQVLINLLSNAVKFTDTGGRVQLTVSRDSDNPRRLRFRVADNGRGIEADKLDTIFQSFVQGDVATARVYGGTGLGLAICRGLVTKMDGEIWVESELGFGSTFFFTARLPETGTESDIMALRQDDSLPEKDVPPCRILLAEDGADNQMLFQAMLRRTPHTVEVVENGSAAISAVREGDFDMIFMDMQMPVMDGTTATSRIRDWEAASNREATPIIALTAYASAKDADNCRAAGCTDFISKPLGKDQLLEVIAQYGSQKS
jgi:signal transduction histidine kinase/BarA-like signal transduction histidine kinase